MKNNILNNIKKLYLKNYFVVGRIILFSLSLLTTFSIASFFKLNDNVTMGNAYNLLYMIIFISISFLIVKSEKVHNKKIRIASVICSLIFSTIYIIGITIIEGTNGYTQSFLLKGIELKIFHFIGLFILFYCCLKVLFEYVIKTNFNMVDKKANIKLFVICWLIILVAWIPYFLAFYPGILSYDSIYQINQALGIQPLTNHHPIIHTFFIKIGLEIGQLVNNINLGVGISILMQMSILSSIFAYATHFLYKKGVSIIYVIITLLFFAFNPLHAVYSITMWKDILFGGFLLLLIILLVETILTSFSNLKSPTQCILYIISVIMIGIYRSNGIYILFVLIPVLLFHLKPFNKKYSLIIIAPMLFILLFKSILIPSLNIPEGHYIEKVGILFKQISSIIASDLETPSKDEAFIEQIVPLYLIKENYSSIAIDSLKGHNDFNHEFLENNKAQFYQVYLSLGIKYPVKYLETYLQSTQGFWYPGTRGYIIETTWIYPNELGIHTDSKIENGVQIFSDCFFRIYENPLLELFFSDAFAFLLIIMSFSLIIIRKNYKLLIILLLPLLLFGTVMIASPINYQPRYTYGLITSTPLIIFVAFISLPSRKPRCPKY